MTWAPCPHGVRTRGRVRHSSSKALVTTACAWHLTSVLVATSKAPVTTSVAPVTTGVLVAAGRHLLLAVWPVTTSVAPAATSVLVTA